MQYESVKDQQLHELIDLFEREFNKKFRLELNKIEIHKFCEGLISHHYTPKKFFGSYTLPSSTSKLKELFPVIKESDLERVNRFVQSSPFFTERLKFLFGTQLALNLALNGGAEIPDEVKDDIDIAKHTAIDDYNEIKILYDNIKQLESGYFLPDRKRDLAPLFRKEKARFRKMPTTNFSIDYDFIGSVVVYLFDLIPTSKFVTSKEICSSIKQIIEKAIKIESRLDIKLPLKTYTTQLKELTLDEAKQILTDDKILLFSERQKKAAANTFK